MADIRYVTKANAIEIVRGLKAAYTNQNAIGKVRVGETLFAADEAIDELKLAAGANMAVSIEGDTVTFAAVDTTYAAVVAGGDPGLMTGADKTKLDGIEAGAEVNLNAFSGVKAGADTVNASAKDDVLELVAGSNVTISVGEDGRLTFAAADTTYALSQDGADGHVLTFTPSSGQATTITIPDADTTYDPVVADSDTPGLMTGADKSKLDGIAAGAQVNVVETVKVNGSSLTPDGNKAVDVTIATAETGVGTLAVNGATVAVHGLGSAAAAELASHGVADGETGLVTGDEVYDAINAQISTVYKPAGNIAPEGLVAGLLVEANLGKVYNLTADLTLDAASAALFKDGEDGETILEGTDVSVIEDGGEYKFNALAGFVDLSSYVEAADLGGLTASEIQDILAEA